VNIIEKRYENDGEAKPERMALGEMFDWVVHRAFWVPWLVMGLIVLVIFLGPHGSRCDPGSLLDRAAKHLSSLF
jgi:hypothetical protein